ncbi:A/G-specific adenine glycosylase [Candidatus Parcubacteria bacterium]|nr:A/G-specific adenine glycosylase [Candidatus Parcubacteria bacterium]
MEKWEIGAFQKKVLAHFRTHGRVLPWRETRDPYRILLSEIMLQQTQVERVRSYYTRFLKAFPTIQKLAAAPLRDVLVLWQGLGYNRRAKYLHEAAIALSKNKAGFPKDAAALRALPGVGPYTASAVAAFAYGAPEILIETNIRTAYLHHFFAERKDVSDTEILPLIEQTLYKKDPRIWYYALMDYGAHLKSILPNPSRRSVHHKKQAAFKGSNRELRGAILKHLALQKSLSKADLFKKLLPLKRSRAETGAVLEALSKEGLVRVSKDSLALAS